MCRTHSTLSLVNLEMILSPKAGIPTIWRQVPSGSDLGWLEVKGRREKFSWHLGQAMSVLYSLKSLKPPAFFGDMDAFGPKDQVMINFMKLPRWRSGISKQLCSASPFPRRVVVGNFWSQVLDRWRLVTLLTFDAGGLQWLGLPPSHPNTSTHNINLQTLLATNTALLPCDPKETCPWEVTLKTGRRCFWKPKIASYYDSRTNLSMNL